MRKGRRQTIIFVGTEADAGDAVSFDWSPAERFLWGEQNSRDTFTKQGQG